MPAKRVTAPITTPINERKPPTKRSRKFNKPSMMDPKLRATILKYLTYGFGMPIIAETVGVNYSVMMNYISGHDTRAERNRNKKFIKEVNELRAINKKLDRRARLYDRAEMLIFLDAETPPAMKAKLLIDIAHKRYPVKQQADITIHNSRKALEMAIAHDRPDFIEAVAKDVKGVDNKQVSEYSDNKQGEPSAANKKTKQEEPKDSD